MKVLPLSAHYKCRLRLYRLQQWSAAQNRYYSFHVVGKHVKRHLRCYLVSSPHQEVSRPHPALYGPERMLRGPPAQSHLVGVLVEPLLNLLQHSLVLPTRDTPFRGQSCTEL